ncbi:MAG: hypothetical protein KatS3mg057_0172 [Herpetosiphonaceae bacterium]|nr:MAG: hypothetical protein KatS3mg057_0172 [Herpetosiphonaceae bacterium]
MDFHDPTAPICWRLHLSSPPQKVYEMLASDEGRARFWAESASERDGAIHFIFPNRLEWRGQILERRPPQRFAVEYFGGSTTTFELEDDGAGGTDLFLTDGGVPPADRAEVSAGWASVLLALKAAVDFGIDLRNHDPRRTWDEGYVEN